MNTEADILCFLDPVKLRMARQSKQVDGKPMSQIALGRLTGLASTKITALERLGTQTDVRISTLFRLANALDCEMEHLITKKN